MFWVVSFFVTMELMGACSVMSFNPGVPSNIAGNAAVAVVFARLWSAVLANAKTAHHGVVPKLIAFIFWRKSSLNGVPLIAANSTFVRCSGSPCQGCLFARHQPSYHCSYHYFEKCARSSCCG